MDTTSKDNKKLMVYQSGSLREFVRTVNEYSIQKEDILAVFQDKHSYEYVLLYYK